MAAVTVCADFSDDDCPTPNPVATCVSWRWYMAQPRVPALPVQDPSWTRKALLDYHSQFVTLRTRAMDQAFRQLKLTLLVNNRQQGTARRGLVVSGPPGAGKSTTLMELGRAFELSEQRRQPRHTNYLPVAAFTARLVERLLPR